MTTTDPTPLAEQIAREHTLHTVWPERCSCSCGATLDFPDGTPSTDFRYTHAAHIATVTEQAVRELVEEESWLAEIYRSALRRFGVDPDELDAAFREGLREATDG